MLANASIQNTTTLQGLPLFVALIDFPAHVVASSSQRLDPPFRGPFRGDDMCWLGASRCSSCFEPSPKLVDEVGNAMARARSADLAGDGAACEDALAVVRKGLER